MSQLVPRTFHARVFNPSVLSHLCQSGHWVSWIKHWIAVTLLPIASHCVA